MNRNGIGLLIAVGALSITSAFADEPSHLPGDTVTITWDGARAPVGRFLLIRKDKAMCAVRFTHAQRFHDQKQPTTFNSGEESFSAEYDWWFQGDGSGDFMKSTVTFGHRKLNHGPLKGIGRLAFQTGDIYLDCGSFDLLWRYPSWVGFWGTEKRGDYGIELAPTPWRELANIDLSDRRLKWHRYDAGREFREIPLDDYWSYR